MKETFWSCNGCDKARDPLLYKTGTSGNAERHLRQRHNIVHPRDNPQTPSSSEDIRNMLGAKRQRLDNIPTTADAADLFRRTLVRWVVKANIPRIQPGKTHHDNATPTSECGDIGGSTVSQAMVEGRRIWIARNTIYSTCDVF